MPGNDRRLMNSAGDAGPQPVRILVVFMGAEGVADTIPMK